ncbi:MAG: 5'/3'-nucleotidase SurE [Acidimicrobiales bacterium]
MRILVTNDDGVRAPGIAALARAAVTTGHDVVVVAPLVDYSGAGAAVGPVHSRDGVDYESHVIDELDVPTYGIDGPPALAVILACVGGFGPRPDLVLSGINHGINVGRSAMHSGTIGAALTAAHFGLRCLASSIRWGPDPVPWETPATLSAALVPILTEAPPGTVLNLNVPNVAMGELRGLRLGHLGRGGVIRSAVHDAGDDASIHPHLSLPPAGSGTLRLDLTPPRTPTGYDLDTDAGLLAHDFASLTPLVGVREAGGEECTVVSAALELLYRLPGVGPGDDDAPLSVDGAQDAAVG